MAQVLFPGRRFTDTNGEPINGGKLYVYEAGTTTPLDTYTDEALSTAADNPIVLDSAGLIPVRYAAPDEYKFVLKSSDDATTYFTIDNATIIDPATASAVATTTITSNTTVAAGDLDRLFYGNTASGDVTITADSETLGSGFIFHAKKSSSDANSLIVSGTGGQVIDGNSTFALDAQYDSATFISLGAAGWAILAQTLDTATLVSDNAIQRVQVALTAGRLEYTSATVVTLNQYKGGYVCFPYGTTLAIPSSGVSATYNNLNINGTSGQTLSADTLYYVYAWDDSSGTLKLDFSTTGYNFDGSTGIAQIASNGTRVLVGMVYTNSSSQFDDSATKRNVASWHNRRRRAFTNNYTTDRTLSGSSYSEINSEIRCQFLTWGDSAVDVGVRAIFSTVSNNDQQMYVGASIDGSTSPSVFIDYHELGGINIGGGMPSMTVGGHETPAIGLRYLTLVAKTSAGSATMTSETSVYGAVEI